MLKKVCIIFEVLQYIFFVSLTQYITAKSATQVAVGNREDLLLILHYVLCGCVYQAGCLTYTAHTTYLSSSVVPCC